MDREAWRAVIHGVTKSRTWLSDWTELSWSYTEATGKSAQPLLEKDVIFIILVKNLKKNLPFAQEGDILSLLCSTDIFKKTSPRGGGGEAVTHT